MDRAYRNPQQHNRLSKPITQHSGGRFRRKVKVILSYIVVQSQSQLPVFFFSKSKKEILSDIDTDESASKAVVLNL